MKYLTILFLSCVCFLGFNANLQAQTERMTDEDIREINQHQFYLDKPATSIELLEYEKDQQPIKGEISGDGFRVIMDDYVKKGRVKAIVVYTDGTKEEISKSSCFIDPVIPL